jgi:hypothetical protein
MVEWITYVFSMTYGVEIYHWSSRSLMFNIVLDKEAMVPDSFHRNNDTLHSITWLGFLTYLFSISYIWWVWIELYSIFERIKNFRWNLMIKFYKERHRGWIPLEIKLGDETSNKVSFFVCMAKQGKSQQ